MLLGRDFVLITWSITYHLGTGKLRNEKKRNETKRKQNPTKSVK